MCHWAVIWWDWEDVFLLSPWQCRRGNTHCDTCLVSQKDENGASGLWRQSRLGDGIVLFLCKEVWVLLLVFLPYPVKYSLLIKDKPVFLPQTHKETH